MLKFWRAVSLSAAMLIGLESAGASPSDSDDDASDSEVVAGVHTVSTTTGTRRGARKEKGVAFDSRWLEPFFSSPALRKAALDFRQEQWAAAESGFTKGASRLAARSDERQAARFLTALAKANQSKWAEAAALFEALYREYPRLGPYHAYNAARARLREGELQAALDWAAKVPVGSVSDAEAALVALDALRGLSRWKDAAGA
ncbi:MAG: hypothetical protein H7X95_09730, partial [Deltaproteobacteria bacterium]|nr:hypothetical protein [Deltaproteobacteria bacterium]